MKLSALILCAIWAGATLGWAGEISRRVEGTTGSRIYAAPPSSSSGSQGTSSGLGIHNYKVIETSYGPAIQRRDWSSAEASLVSTESGLEVISQARSRIQWTRYPLGGGGDIATALRFRFSKFGPDSEFSINYYCPPDDPRRKGLRVVFRHDQVIVFQGGEVIAEQGFPTTERNKIHEVKFVTLATDFLVALDGLNVAQGKDEPTAAENKLFVFFEANECDVTIESFTEEFIAHDVVFPEWRRKELLYEESFSADSLRDNWTILGQTPDRDGESVTFKRVSIGVLKQRFEGPVAVETIAMPLPTRPGHKFEGRLSDAIFLWMLDKPGGDLVQYLRDLNSPSLEHLNLLPFYWVDFGGTDNQTTRLRRSPNRQLVRQFVDAPRLLQRPGTTYRIITVQNGPFIEFWVDDQPWIKFYDAQPIYAGHAGYRGFIGDLKITGMKVWRIESAP